MRKIIEGLSHRFGMSKSEFYELIDKCGGWPLEFKYVGFQHTDERAAGFTNSPYNDGWWTILANSDDYHIWKLSPDALQRIADAVRDAITMSYPDISKLFIFDSTRGRAVIKSQENHKP